MKNNPINLTRSYKEIPHYLKSDLKNPVINSSVCAFVTKFEPTQQLHNMWNTFQSKYQFHRFSSYFMPVPLAKVVCLQIKFAPIHISAFMQIFY